MHNMRPSMVTNFYGIEWKYTFVMLDFRKFLMQDNVQKSLLPVLKHIPIEYLENFQHNRRIIKKVFSQNTKLAIISLFS